MYDNKDNEEYDDYDNGFLVFPIGVIIICSIIFYFVNKEEKKREEFISASNRMIKLQEMKEYEEWADNFKFWELLENLQDLSDFTNEIHSELKNDDYIYCFDALQNLKELMENFISENKSQIKILSIMSELRELELIGLYD